ncbi:hypothetical protein J6590_031095 [Homalodisca vitripennis]|nr:hypothetical protein J6590_031095 [Homalodisca vitripennis]
MPQRLARQLTDSRPQKARNSPGSHNMSRENHNHAPITGVSGQVLILTAFYATYLVGSMYNACSTSRSSRRAASATHQITTRRGVVRHDDTNLTDATRPPEPPAARPSVSRGPDCATVAWSSPAYDGGCVLTGYRVEMRTTDSQDWSVVADRCHSLSHVVRGLTPGQSYVFRVRAENIHGASDSSAESFPFTLDSPDRRDEELEPEGEGEEGTLMQVSLEPGEQFLQRYSVHEELGKGRYGVVHKVTDLRTQHTMAAKFVRCIKKQDREKVQEEIDIMNCLRHSKLLQLVAAFENPKDIIMIME